MLQSISHGESCLASNIGLRRCRTAILERCLRRLEFDKKRDAEAKAQADQLEAERMAMQSIDWCVQPVLHVHVHVVDQSYSVSPVQEFLSDCQVAILFW